MDAMLQLHFNVQGRLLEEARACEASVFLQSFGNTRDQLDAEYGPYNDQSVFVAVTDESGQAIGACRLITPGPAGLKTLNDISREPWNVDGARVARLANINVESTWDIATLGVRSSYRGGRMMVAMALYHAILVATRANGVETAIGILDDHVRRILSGAGHVMPALPGTRTATYLGSPASTPMFGNIASTMDAQRRSNPEAYRLMALGVGLDGIAVPATEAFILTPQVVAVPAPIREFAAVA